MEKFPNFLEGEKVIIEAKPASFIAYSLPHIGAAFILWIILASILFYFVSKFDFVSKFISEAELFYYYLPVTLLIILLLFVISYALRYRWEYYWITNLRIIQRKGLIGYHFYSAPYERVSDVILSRNWIERIIGVGSVRVQTLAGSITPGGTFGAELRMLALANPEKVQKIIWQFLEKKTTWTI